VAVRKHSQAMSWEYKVLLGLKFFIRSRPAPAKVKYTPHPLQQSSPLQPHTLLTTPASQTIPARAYPALFRSQTRTCPKTSKNS